MYGGKPWVIHSQNSYTTIHIAQDNGEGDAEDPLVIAKTKLKVNKAEGLTQAPSKEVPNYKNEWTNFFEKPYNWCMQQSLYEALKSIYKV
jgi:hypothetical protein